MVLMNFLAHLWQSRPTKNDRGNVLTGQTHWSGQELSKHLQKLGVTGTLWLETSQGGSLQLLQQAAVVQQHDFSNYQASSTGVSFCFYPHNSQRYPHLASSAVASPQVLLAALPQSCCQRWCSYDIDVPRLLGRLVKEGFTGVVRMLATSEPEVSTPTDDNADASSSSSASSAASLEQNLEQGAIFFYQGAMHVALYDHGRENESSRQALALKAMLRLAGQSADIVVQRLEPLWLRSLLSFATETRPSSTRPSQFTGIKVMKKGYSYYREGEVYLFVASPATTLATGHYPALATIDDVATRPLSVPIIPLSWQAQQHRLTLRGQDALNPMTEVAMRFASLYGQRGRHILSQLQAGQSLDAIIKASEESFAELQGLLESLIREGFIQRHHEG